MRSCLVGVVAVPFSSVLYTATFGYGNVVGMHAFGLVENGAYALAEEKADVALAIQSTDIWAVHAMAHVYEMEVGWGWIIFGYTTTRSIFSEGVFYHNERSHRSQLLLYSVKITNTVMRKAWRFPPR